MWNLTDAYFTGDAPTTVGETIFGEPRDNFTIHFDKDTSGWTTPTWNGYRTNSGTISVQDVRHLLIQLVKLP